ncbi:ABC-2 type transport system permease protein [Crossiella equi]|uniref:ABC-2 type transport system permease protein n=1 Tax=Crossiella equi TaxID=130796 RepID=A0ABS5AC35_9PSEU|nr:ABC transporter permease [Crossiella equi]MBP2473260.1 ABC-2 type transport system permease protein [Crossiella equi]
MRAALALGLTELKLLLRKKINAFSVLGVPAAMCLFAYRSDRPENAEGWGALFAHGFLFVLLLSTFLVSTTVFTGRRQSLVLKRLRTAELTDTALIAGIITPLVVVTLAQMTIYLGFCLYLGAPLPAQPLLVPLALLAGTAVAVLAGAATASLSTSVEVTQVTAVPVVIAAVGGMFATFADAEWLRAVGLALPLNGPADLLAKAWGGIAAGVQLPSAGLVLTAGTVLSAVLLGLVAARWYRWEPRA